MNEKKVKFELGEILNQIQKNKDDVTKMNAEIEESYDAYDNFLKTPASSQMLKFFPDFVKTKKMHISAIENTLYALDNKYKLKVAELAQKKAEVKIMEGLKEKEEELYNKKKLRKERETLEEFVAIRHFQDKRDQDEKF